MSGQALESSEAARVLCTGLLLLVPFAAAGLALINAGLTRTRSVSQSLFTAVFTFAIAAVVYFFCGFAWQASSDWPAFTVVLGSKSWNWLGRGPFFLHGVHQSEYTTTLAAAFGMMSSAIAALIPVGSGAERWKFTGIFAATAVMSGWTFPLFAHWVWGGGWLSALGANFGLGQGVIDNGGSGSIHAVGGLTALAIVWIVGPRRGKYNSHGIPAATPGHNAAFVLFGCFLALVGWLGLNTVGSLLFAQLAPAEAPWIAVNTILGACGGGIASLVMTRLRFGKPDASLCANGWVSGLVAGSAGCLVVKPAGELIIGLVAGMLVIFVIEILEMRLKVDDPAGAIAVHGVAGLWGLLAVGLFTSTSQFTAQLLGIATLLGFIFPMTYLLNVLLNRVVRFRVASDGERQGMDLFELGAGAYPEFVIHRDEGSFR